MDLDFRLSDPEYTDFKPLTAAHAIMRFRRLQKQGISPWKYPECFVECATTLNPIELEKFERWIVNPTGEPQARQASRRQDDEKYEANEDDEKYAPVEHEDE